MPLGAYGSEDVAASRAAMAAPEAEQLSAWAPQSDEETRLLISRLKLALSDAWEYPRAGFEREWRDLPQSQQKATLRAGNPFLPDSAARPMVKVDRNSREDMANTINRLCRTACGYGLVNISR
jgi:hypothetical protein